MHCHFPKQAMLNQQFVSQQFVKMARERSHTRHVLDHLESQDHQCCKRMSEQRLLIQEHHKLVFYNLDPTAISVKEKVFYRPVLQSNEAQSKNLSCHNMQHKSRVQLLSSVCVCYFGTHHMIVKVKTTNEFVLQQFQNDTCPIIS